MTVKPKIVAYSILLGTLILPVLAAGRTTQNNPAIAQDRGPGGAGHAGGGPDVLTNVRFLTHYLTLTSDQITHLQALLATLKTAEQTVQDSRATICQQLRTDLAAADPATVGTDYLALIANQAKIQAALTAFESSFAAILTADQQTKFQTLIQGADPQDGTDALPGCPPAATTAPS